MKRAGSTWKSSTTPGRHMSRLIEDLLRLARFTKAPLRKETVNLSDLASQIVGRLSAAAPERKIEVRIAGGLEVNGDAGLLRGALENLLSNAWKYTSNRRTRGLSLIRRCSRTVRAFIGCGTTARASTCNTPRSCFNRFAGCTLRKSFPGQALAWRRCGASSIGTEGEFGLKRKRTKAQRFILLWVKTLDGTYLKEPCLKSDAGATINGKDNSVIYFAAGEHK